MYAAWCLILNGEKMIDGFINVYKEQGFTSLDVVAKLRGILKQKKIGHTGTLDPMAEGVLLVCLGRATKLSEMLTDKDKKYRCTMKLGIRSDTEDITGSLTYSDEPVPGEAEIRSAVKFYEGEYDQIPPMYSAIKVNGRKLYELARNGQVIERQPRRVHIYSIDNIKVDGTEVMFDVHCSKGTYIRSLCRDIGDKLGCGAVMEALVRTSVREFDIKDSVTLGEIECLRDRGELDSHVYGLDYFLNEYASLTVNSKGQRFLANGNKLSTDMFTDIVAARNGLEISGSIVRIYDGSGEFTALYTADTEQECYRAYKMFLT